MSKPFFLRVKAIALTGIVSALMLLVLPAKAQDEGGEAAEPDTAEVVVDDSEGPAPEVQEELRLIGLTTEDLTISTEELQLLVKPLTVDELQVEVDAWIAILKERVTKISQTEVAAKRETQIIDDREKARAELDQARTKLKALQEQGASDAEISTARLALSEARRGIARVKVQANAFDLDENLAEAITEAEEALIFNNAVNFLQDAQDQLASVTSDKDQATKLIEDLDEALSEQELTQERLERIVSGLPLHRSITRDLKQRKETVAEAVGALVDAPMLNLDDPNKKITPEELKRQLVANATLLEANLPSLVSRVQVIVDELERKGGDITSYDQYISSVTGLELDVTDAEGLRVRLVTWLESEEGGIKFGIGLLKFVGIMAAAAILAPRVGSIASALLSRVGSISSLFRDFAVMTVKRGVLVVGLLLALSAIGVSLGPILALVGGASFVLAFALQSNLGNFASGLLLLIAKPFDVGDEVNIGGYWAFVDSISLANTKLKAFDGSIITLPNNNVWGGDIINYTHDSTKRKVSIGIHIKFTQDVGQIEKLWDTIVAEDSDFLTDPGHSIFPWNSSYSYYIYVSLNAWTKTDLYWGVYARAIKTLQKKIQENGIELTATVHEVNVNNAPKEIMNQLSAGPDLA